METKDSVEDNVGMERAQGANRIAFLALILLTFVLIVTYGIDLYLKSLSTNGDHEVDFNDVRTWAMNLLSVVIGAAVTYNFGGSGGNSQN